MPIHYKFDVLEALKNQGYSTYRLRKEKILSQTTIKCLRNGEPISWSSLEQICKILNCQPGDVLIYQEEK
jgi:DNA-binding Xre family transcriptional regulator